MPTGKASRAYGSKTRSFSTKTTRSSRPSRGSTRSKTTGTTRKAGVPVSKTPTGPSPATIAAARARAQSIAAAALAGRGKGSVGKGAVTPTVSRSLISPTSTIPARATGKAFGPAGPIAKVAPKVLGAPITRAPAFNPQKALTAPIAKVTPKAFGPAGPITKTPYTAPQYGGGRTGGGGGYTGGGGVAGPGVTAPINPGVVTPPNVVAPPAPPVTAPGVPTAPVGSWNSTGRGGTFGRFNRQRLNRGPRSGLSMTPEMLRRIAMQRFAQRG